MRNIYFGVFGLAAAVALATPAAATTYVDTGTQTGNNGGGPTLGTGQYLAGQFSLGSSATLTDVLGYIASNGTDSIRVALRANTGNLPGATLYSSTFTTLSNVYAGNWQGVTGQSWSVAAGTYWISFENLTSSNAFMPASAPSPLSSYAVSGNQGASWFNGAGGWGLRVMGNAGAAVPEPASWAMMIAGFGVVGLALRRRKTVRVRYAA